MRCGGRQRRDSEICKRMQIASRNYYNDNNNNDIAKLYYRKCSSELFMGRTFNNNLMCMDTQINIFENLVYYWKAPCNIYKLLC